MRIQFMSCLKPVFYAACLTGLPVGAWAGGCNPYKELCPPSIEPFEEFRVATACNPYKEICPDEEIQKFAAGLSQLIEGPVAAAETRRAQRE